MFSFLQNYLQEFQRHPTIWVASAMLSGKNLKFLKMWVLFRLYRLKKKSGSSLTESVSTIMILLYCSRRISIYN
jgi:hypothetical protein